MAKNIEAMPSMPVRVVVMSSAQVGKTEVINTCGYHIIEAGHD